MNDLAELNPEVEAQHMPDLQNQACPADDPSEFVHLFDGDADRFLAQHVLAGLERLYRRGDVEGIRDADDDRLDLRIAQHLVVVEIDLSGVVESAKAPG